MSEEHSTEPRQRRPRVSRPTPSHLFAQRQGGDGVGNGADAPPRRSTRVIPALAQTDPPAAPTDEPGAPAPSAAEPAPPAAKPQIRARAEDYPPDLVFIVRADGTVLYVNRPLGPRGEEEVIGSDIFDWIFPDQHTVVRDCLGRVFRSGRADGHDLHGIQEHAPEAWYECRVSPNMREGSVVSATVIARDVTRYKRSEQELRTEHAETKRLLDERSADLEQAKLSLASRAEASGDGIEELRRFRMLMDEAGEAVFVTDAGSGLVVDLNETACRWLRRERAELIGREAHALGIEFQILPTEDLDLQFTETRDTRRPLILDGGIHRRGDGSTFPVEVAVAHHGMGGHEYILAVVRDVKGRRWAEQALEEAEARYQALFQQSWDAIYLTTRAGKIVEANDGAVALFGYDREDFVGTDARDLLPRPDDIRAFQREMAERGTVTDLAVELRTQDGRTFAGRLSASCRRDADGGLRGYQWLVRAAAGLERAAPAAGRPPGTVLLVEREERLRDEARSALEHAGLRVLTAPNAEGAIEIYRAHHGEVVATVLDTRPGEPGAEAAVREIRRLDPSALIVILSPDDPAAAAAGFSEIGIGAFLKKPTHPLTLVQTVRDLVAALENGG